MERQGDSWLDDLKGYWITELGSELQFPVGPVLNPSANSLVTRLNWFGLTEPLASPSIVVPKGFVRTKLVIKQVDAPLFDAFQIVSAIKTSPRPVDTFAIGTQALFGQLVFAAGEKRYVTPDTFFALGFPRFVPEHQYASQEELDKAKKEHDEGAREMIQNVADRVASFCSRADKPFDKARYLADLSNREKPTLLKGEEIVQYGFADSATYEEYKENLLATYFFLEKAKAELSAKSDKKGLKEQSRF